MQNLDTLGKRAQYARTIAKKTQAEVAKAWGVSSQQAYFKIENGQTLNPRNIHRLASALSVSVEWLTGESETGGPDSVSVSASKPNKKSVYNDPPYTGPPQPPMLPIFGTAAGSGERIAVNSGELPIDYISWPIQMPYSDQAFGLRIIGDSMEPRFFAGEHVVVYPLLQPAKKTDCAILYKTGEACIKFYLGRDETHVHVRQFNPIKDFTIPLADIDKIVSAKRV